MSNSLSKKKEIPLNETLSNLCKDLLRFIDRKIIKKFVSPNIAQIPKELRNPDKKDNENHSWTYFYKDKEITEEEKIKDVFKDDKFLGYLQNLNNSLILVVDYLDQNQKTIKKLEDEVKNKEENINSLNELKNLLNYYLDENKEKIPNSEQKDKEKYNTILEDPNLINIMSKIQSLYSNKNVVDTKISQNVINLNRINNNNNNSNSNNSNNISVNSIKSNIIKNDSNNNQNQKINTLEINTNNKEIIDIDNYNINNIISSDNKNKNNQNKSLINQCLNTPSPNINKNKNDEDVTSEPNSTDKNEIDNLIDNFKLNISLFNKSLKENNNKSEDNQIFKNENKEENQNDNIFLNKKTEREKELKNNDTAKLNNNTNSNNKIKINSEKKKAKNKKKKNNNKSPINSDISDKKIEKENSEQISLKEELAKLPVLKPKIDKKKDITKFDYESKDDKIDLNNQNNIKVIKEIKEQDIDDELVKGLLEDNEINKNEKNNNVSVEDEFSLEFSKKFRRLNSKNQRTKIINDILSSIQTNDIPNYNPRINGPYLVGSYRTISDLPSINYITPIDIMYTYKDILIDKKITDYTVKNILEKRLDLNLIDYSGFYRDDNMTKIKAKCSSKINTNIIISFNIAFIDIGDEQNEKIINNIIFNAEKIDFENENEEKILINMKLYFRIWRRKNKLLFILPELLDEIAKYNINSNNNLGTCILNSFYVLYNGINNLYSKQNQGKLLPKHKMLVEKIFKNMFEKENNKKKIRDAILQTNTMINNRKFEELFKIGDN